MDAQKGGSVGQDGWQSGTASHGGLIRDQLTLRVDVLGDGVERGRVAGVIGFGHDWATLLARGPRAPLTALRFASASRRKLATPLATQSCGFEHSSRLPAAAAIAQPER